MRQKLAPAIFLLLLSFFTGGLSAQKQAVHKKYILHQIASLDGKSFSYDTTWMYYKLMVSPFDMYQIDTLWVDGKYQEIKRDKKSEVPEHIELNAAKTKLKEQQEQIKSKVDSIKNLQQVKDDLKKEIAEKQTIKPLQLLEYSAIGKQKWTSKNLTEADLKSISKEFTIANSYEEWKEALIKGTPAYCYHRDDNNKSNGVLLNLIALKKVHDKLEEMQSNWRLPVQADFDNLLNTLKSVKSVSIVSMLTSSSTTIPAWKKPGIDLFDMHFIPLSYRRNNSTQWYGMTEATIYCLNADDLGLTTTLKMVEINDSEEDKNTLVIKSKDITGEDNNIGVYVRLIKK